MYLQQDGNWLIDQVFHCVQSSLLVWQGFLFDVIPAKYWLWRGTAELQEQW